MTAETLAHAALAKPPTERAAFLDQACAGQPDLRAAVEALLAAHDAGPSTPGPPSIATGEFTPSSDDLGGGNAVPPAPDEVTEPAPGGTVIAGRYALVRKLGEGGMGEVWVARQTEPVRRQVALKLIKPGMDSRAMLARFEQERQALAVMDHPNIARVLDGGVTATGQPYFVMELVDGQPLTRFCDDRKLTPRDRLELFVPICQAVQHAHQKGIVHRDLKPANILVAVHDGRPVPKVIDFGVAKATGARLTDESMATQIGAVIGTFEYMSPEQASGEQDVDTRADIYSLGVVLYELLTGLRPIDAKRLRKAALLEMVMIILEEEPSRPSTRLSTAEGLPSLAALRQTEPRKLTAMLRGDLDWVAMKCLEKNRDRRYETANGLARDVQRYLADEPVDARPPTAGYRLRKFIRRNRVTVTAAAAVAAALVLATGVSVWFGMSEARQRAEADRLRDLAEANAAAEARARTRAEAVTAFVTAALNASDPMQRGRQETTIAQAMTAAVAEIASGRFRDDPETEAGLQDTIGLILKNNGKYRQARPLLEQALATRERVFQGDHPAVALSLNNLAALHVAEGRLDRAEPLLARCLAMFEATRGGEHNDVAACLNSLAVLHYFRGQFDRAEPLFRRALAMREKVLGPTHRDLALTLNDFALLYSAQRKYADAEPLMKRSLAINERALGPDHPDVAANLNSLATMFDNQGRYAEGVPLYVRALAICEKALGPDHAVVATGLHNLAESYRELGEYARAEPLYRRALAIREKAFGPDHADVGIVLNNLAILLKVQRRFAEAEPLYLRSLAIDEKLLGPEHPEVGTDLHNLAAFYEARDQPARAEELYKRALAIREKALGPDHTAVAATLNNLALLHLTRRQFADAERLARRAVAVQRKALGAGHPNVAHMLTNLARIHQGMGKAAEARQGFDEALAILRKQSPAGSAVLARVLWRSATARMESKAPGDFAAALRELEEAVSMAKTFLPPDHPGLKEYGDTLARCKAAVAEQDQPGDK